MNPDNITPPQPQSQLPAHHVSNSTKIVMLLLGIALIATLSYFTWYVGGETDTAEEVAPSVKEKTEQVATSTDTVDCGDKAYAFKLTFGDKWEGKKVKEVTPTYALVTCYFEMPTTSTDSVWTTAATDHSAGYASVFAVSVYTPAQWAAAQEEANKPTELGHTDNYYWGWAPAQALPDDLQTSKIADDVKNVVATFKAAE